MSRRKEGVKSKSIKVSRSADTGRFTTQKESSARRPVSTATEFAKKFYDQYGEAMSTLANE